MIKEQIRFEFEDFLEEHERALPEGLDPYFLNMVKNVQDPYKNLISLPRTLLSLPMNAVISQSWQAILQIYSLILILALPSIGYLLFISIQMDNTLFGGTAIFFIILGTAVSPFYLKISYQILNNMIESRRAPWLVDEVKPIFDERYRSWNMSYFMIGTVVIISLIYDAKLIQMMVLADLGVGGFILGIIFLVLGQLGVSLLLYLALNSFMYVITNTRIYDLFLVKITNRVKGYTEGHESIYTQKNYEVVKVLADSPGLSIRSLGDIPQLGLLSSIVTVNAMLFIIIGPFIIEGRIADALNSMPTIGADNTKLTYIIVLGTLISALAAFGAVIMPLFRISSIMARFKNKALMELDPYIFEEMTSLTINREKEISNETIIMSMLRDYIYSMKISPVAPLRLVYIVGISLIYALRIIPLIVSIFS